MKRLWREKEPILRKTRSRRKRGNGGERCCEAYSYPPQGRLLDLHLLTRNRVLEGSAGWMLHGIPGNL